MSKNVLNNRLINEIMSNSSPVTILLSKSDGDNIEFVSDLCNCYKNTYWINSEYDNMYSFTITLAKKVFGDDHVMMQKLMQFKYCELDYDKDNIVLNVALQKISTLEGDCLLVMDNLEQLPKVFNHKLIELLIKNCPKNLKILLISETFLELNYSLFEPNCPKLIDETVLASTKKTEFEDILKLDLSQEDLAFLCYISQISHFNRNFASNIYHKGNEILTMLSIKYKHIVFCKGNNLYWINSQLHDYLVNLYPNLRDYEFFNHDIKMRLFEYYLQDCKQLKAIRHAYINGWYDLADTAIKNLLNDDYCSFMVEDFGKNVTADTMRAHQVGDYFYCKFLLCVVEYSNGCTQLALDIADKLLLEAQPKSKDSYRLFCIKCYCLADLGYHKEAAELCYNIVREVIDDDSFEAAKSIQCLLGYMPNLFRNTNMVLDVSEVKKREKILIKKEYENYYWYPKIIQAVAEVYFDLGYYSKAIDRVELLKEILPFYMLPHKLVDYYYYSGDIDKYMKSAKCCLENSRIYNIDSDLASVYILLAKGNAYYEKYDEALEYMDLAVKCENSSEQVKYYAIATRALMYAKMGKVDYAKDIAIIYAKICELNNSKFTYYFYAVLAFCYWNQKNLRQTKYYANKCLLSASAKSGTWFMASSLSISCIIINNEIRDAKALLTKFVNTCKLFSMEAYIIDCYCCFEIPLQRAKEEGIMLDYLKVIDDKLAEKRKAIITENKIYIKLFGNTSVMVNNEQIIWKTKKTKELFLLYVWAGDKGIDRKRIIDLLWKDYVYNSSLNNLKTTNNIIRNTLSQYNVPFKLEYINSRYTLYLPNSESDYSNLLEILDNYNDDLPLATQMEMLRNAFMYYDNGFALEINNEEFDEVRTCLQSKMMVKNLKLLDNLIAKGEYLEAKMFFNYLERTNVDEESYNDLRDKIDNNLHKRF